jgi:diaminopimelate epimerase
MSDNNTKLIPFHKMHGSGNDFVLVDNREAGLNAEAIANLAEPVCRRKFGVGADGLIVLDNAPEGQNGIDYIWHFYNSDGSAAEMCGNGSRCAARLAFELGLAGRKHVLGTTAGPIRAHVLPDSSEVKVQMTDPVDLALDVALNVNGSSLNIHFVNTGVPHVVVIGNNVKSVDVNALGREIRNHERFAPAGTNVNFVQVVDKGHLMLRTYERGVEDETFACGTGACAAAYVCHSLGLTDPEVEVTTSGGEVLHILIQEGTVFLQGKTAKVASGTFYPEALGLK